MPSTPVEGLSACAQLLAPDRPHFPAPRQGFPHPKAQTRTRLSDPRFFAARRDLSYMPCSSPPPLPFLRPSSFTRIRFTAAANLFLSRPYFCLISFGLKPSSNP